MNRLIPAIYKKIEPSVIAYQLSGLITISRRRGEIWITNGDRGIHIALLNKAEKSLVREWATSHVSVSYYIEKDYTHVVNIFTVPETVSEVLSILDAWAGNSIKDGYE